MGGRDGRRSLFALFLWASRTMSAMLLLSALKSQDILFCIGSNSLESVMYRN